MVVFWALALSGAAVAGNGGFRRASRTRRTRRASAELLLGHDLHRRIFVVVEGADPLHRPVPARQARADGEGPQVHGDANLELAWTVRPVLFLAAIGAFVFYELPGIEDVPSASARADGSTCGSRATGTTGSSVPERRHRVDNMRAPAGRRVKLNISAPDYDVIHSWWVPRSRRQVRRDPGQDQHDLVPAPRPGIYQGRCAELCGIQHANMRATVEGAARGVRRVRARRSPGGRNVQPGREMFRARA